MDLISSILIGFPSIVILLMLGSITVYNVGYNVRYAIVHKDYEYLKLMLAITFVSFVTGYLVF